LGGFTIAMLHGLPRVVFVKFCKIGFC
jgi:hypothetical protein